MTDLIDRKAAIDALCSVCGNDCDKTEFVYNAPQWEQVIMCPEHYALSTLPSAQPKLKLVDITDISEIFEPKFTEEEIQMMQELEAAEMEKAYQLGMEDAQPEIIRCKECRYKELKGVDYYCDHITGEEIMVSPNDYCSWAKRRTDE